MKLNFSWEKGATGLFPMCALDGVEVGGVSPISCLLMDDGGLGVVRSVEWIDRFEGRGAMLAALEHSAGDQKSPAPVTVRRPHHPGAGLVIPDLVHTRGGGRRLTGSLAEP